MSKELMKSKFVSLPSVRVAIISEPNARISFKFWLLLPLDHMHFFNFFIFFYEYFSVLVNMRPMGAKISKCYSSYKSQPKVLTLFLNFLPNGPHKTTFGIFDILKIEILTDFIRFRNIGPDGSENFKTLPLLQIAAISFETCPEFSFQWSSQNYVYDFGNFEFLIFNDFGTRE